MIQTAVVCYSLYPMPKLAYLGVFKPAKNDGFSMLDMVDGLEVGLKGGVKFYALWYLQTLITMNPRSKTNYNIPYLRDFNSTNSKKGNNQLFCLETAHYAL